MVKDVVDGAAAEKLVRERGLVGAGVEGDPLRGSLQVALERDPRARLGGVVVKADVTAESLAEVDVPEREVPLQKRTKTTATPQPPQAHTRNSAAAPESAQGRVPPSPAESWSPSAAPR